MQTIYVDLLFMINFSMDFLTLFIVSRIMCRKVRIIRLCSASAMGGVYSVMSIGFSFKPTLFLVFDIFICFVMCMTAFLEKSTHSGKSYHRFRKMPLYTGMYFLISALLGGMMTAIFNLFNKSVTIDAEEGTVSVWILGLAAVISGIATLSGSKLLLFAGKQKKGDLTIRLGARRIKLGGISDSGNMLKEPITGKSVIIIDKRAAKMLSPEISDNPCDMASNEEKNALLGKILLIPTKTVSGEGLLVGISADEITLDFNGETKSIDAYLAISKKEFSGFEALIPSEFFT